MKKLLTISLLVATLNVFAQDAPKVSVKEQLFGPEVSLTVGSAYVPDSRYNANFNVGVDAFFTKNIGVSAELPFYNPDGVSVDRFSVGMKYRVPIGLLAPYTGAGVIYHWNTEDFDGYVQLGVEARIRKWYGVFAEARYTYTDISSWQGFSAGNWGLFGGVKFVLF